MNALTDSPVARIETEVHALAKERALDLRIADAESQLRILIEEVINRWNERFRMGEVPFHVSDPAFVTERITDNILRYGPLTSLIEDDDVWEIMINGPAEIFVKRHGGMNGYHHQAFENDAHVIRTITKILDESSTAHRKLDPTEGLQDAQLDNGARLHIVHADLARGGHLIVNIRKFTGLAFTTLSELVQCGTINEPVQAFLSACMHARATIVFSGAPGSGKTTLLSCCAGELDPSLRVVIAEEVFETDVPVANVASMQTRAPRPDRPAVDLRRLVSGFLRMAPDIAIVGEVRDAEAMALLLTLSSGVKGYTTVHAASARQALSRLRFVCQLSEAGSNLPMSALNHLVSESIDVVVHSERGPNGPRVTGVIAVEDFVGASESSQFTITELFTRPTPDAPLVWTGNVPSRLTALCERFEIDIPELLRGHT